MITVAASGIVVAQSNGNGDNATAGKSKKTQMICPVTGEKASKNYSYEFEGTTYNFCCTKCKAKFIKNPEKYLKDSKKGHEGHMHDGEMKKMKGHEGHKHSSEMKMKTKIKGKASVMNVVNANCPISGKKVKDDGGTYMYEGKMYGFCCPGCIEKFKKDPEKYIKKI